MLEYIVLVSKQDGRNIFVLHKITLQQIEHTCCSRYCNFFSACRALARSISAICESMFAWAFCFESATGTGASSSSYSSSSSSYSQPSALAMLSLERALKVSSRRRFCLAKKLPFLKVELRRSQLWRCVPRTLNEKIKDDTLSQRSSTR